MQTLRMYFPYMKNSFSYSYNNGRIEGGFNKVKALIEQNMTIVISQI